MLIVMGAFADIQSGVGMIVVGLASVIIGGGGAIFGHRTILALRLLSYKVQFCIGLLLQ
ncbi:hypothetical protein [Paenibacillus alvei]|uniref:hypothetical protein n=1 Tax=Paenibacillus alvei TaxID=44250 RepID=UPI002280DECC|nr:hypothetical protein [Paenibacillus alvei]MCY9579068.1 hypothetical protein [Paenibacillus alvei]